MKYTTTIFSMLLICLIALCIVQPQLMAGDDTSKPDALALFSCQERPTPVFDHTLHEESLGDTGCAKCHHVMDEEKNILVYSEGEEASCAECHTSEPQANTTALREANHKSCTGCHRQMKKEKLTAGPTTCGECHSK